MDEPLQRSLERYDVLDRIAVGGMAEVFLAKAYGAHGFEKTLAIKRILPELARDPEFEARFIAEAKVAVRLSHANVVQVLDFGRIGESLFIAMEYVDGLDLAAMLRKFKDEKRQLPLPAAFHIAIEIIRALDFAHSHNVVHRDVSPSNVLVSRAGEVKLADFGIAVAAQPHRGGGTGPRKVMGKWRYMSPEQARGDTLDTRSDLFSAATVIFELFTNEKLFPGEEAEDIVKNIENMPIPRMSAIRPGIPSRLDDVLAGALARKPIDRPNRPAVVLRSLIELSYESSIMATALDVAEAIAAVAPARRGSLGGRGALDDVIRKQLHEQSVARRTAVTDGKPASTETLEKGGEVSTGLFRKLDADGLARLELDDTKVATPRAKRESEQPFEGEGEEPAASSSTDIHKLFDASLDRDRRTEPGGPPTGQVPKVGESIQMRAQSKALPPPKKKTGPWLLILLVMSAVAAGGVGVYIVQHEPGKQAVVPPPADAAPKELLGTFDIDSIPSGAIITVAGRPQGSGPRSFNVTAGVDVRIKLEKAGYQPFEQPFKVDPGKTFVIRQPLTAAPAKLHVETTPPGAQVTLNGQLIGPSPLDVPLPAAQGGELVISLNGYDPIKQKINLIAGETTTIKKDLKESQKYGSIEIDVEGGAYVEVYFGGKLLGNSYGVSGFNQFSLPVGKQRLLLKKGDKKRVITVNVEAGPVKRVTAKLDSPG
jgi:tRNA A-37 threonylcarbamoyl transferase component Bud32